MDYRWQIETKLDPEALRQILDPYRPFRNDIHFTTGFVTSEFADAVRYANPLPLDKVHYFGPAVTVEAGARVLDIGSNLGYYCHYYYDRGARTVVGLEPDPRLFGAAAVLRAIAGLDPWRYFLLQGDFGDAATQTLLARHGPYDLVLMLGVLNNIKSFATALFALPELLSPGGFVVIEYLAIDGMDPVCRFHRDGFPDDPTHFWSFSEAFIDDLLGKIGVAKTARVLEWQNRDVLGEYKKVMTVYRRAGAA